ESPLTPSLSPSDGERVAEDRVRALSRTFQKSIAVLAVTFSMVSCSTVCHGGPVTIFDGKTFQGWEGDTNKTWRIEDGAIVGGTLTAQVPHNEFICTTRGYTNFVVRLKFKLVGTEGFVNGGVQVRSKHIANPPYELSGYQADMGDGWWGSLYDESRRNKVLVKADPAVIEKALKRNEWNDYEVRCEGRRIRITLNGQQTVDYTEPDESVP